MVKSLLAGCLVLFLVAPVLSGCGAAGATAPSLVPGTANAVIQVQVAKMIASPTLRLAYGELAATRPDLPPTVDDALGQFIEKTGVDLASVSTAIFFADIESADDTGATYAGIIASGQFNESAIVARVQQQTAGTITTSDYKGLTVYAGGHDGVEMAFFGPGRLVAGTAQAVRDTIDVSKGDQQPLGGRIVDTLDRFGTVMMAGAFAPPPGLGDGLGEAAAPQLPLSLDTFRDLDTVGFSVDVPALTVNVRLDAHFASPASVQDARDAVTGLISIFKATTPDQNLKAALAKVQVSAADSWLSLRAVAGVAEIWSLIGNLPAK
jgi:hypothetical protein